MRLITVLVLACCTLSGCVHLKKQRNKQKQETHKEIQATTKYSRITTEKADTAIQVKGSHLSGSVDLDPFLVMEKELENEDLSVKLRYDPGTKKLDVNTIQKPKSHQVSINKVTQETGTQEIKAKEEVKTKSNVLNVNRKTNHLPALGLLLLMIGITYIIYRYKNRLTL